MTRNRQLTQPQLETTTPLTPITLKDPGDLNLLSQTLHALYGKIIPTLLKHKEIMPGSQTYPLEEGVYQASNLQETLKCLTTAKLGEGQKFAELGSGDARVSVLASLMGAESHAYEIDEHLNTVAKKMIDLITQEGQKINSNKIHFHQKDFTSDEVDLTDADVIYYTSKGSYDKNKPSIMEKFKTLKKGAKVIIYNAFEEYSIGDKPPQIIKSGLQKHLIFTI